MPFGRSELEGICPICRQTCGMDVFGSFLKNHVVRGGTILASLSVSYGDQKMCRLRVPTGRWEGLSSLDMARKSEQLSLFLRLRFDPGPWPFFGAF